MYVQFTSCVQGVPACLLKIMSVGKMLRKCPGKTKKYLNKLEERIYKLNTYYDYDVMTKYRGIKEIKDLFDSSITEDYYKLIIVNSASNNNYIQYESRGDKILTIGEYLSIIEQYLVDKINDYKK